MNRKLFTSRSIDQLDSPEDLQDYIRSTSPGLWMILTALLLLLAGSCIWGIFGRIERSVTVSAEVSDGTAVAGVSDMEELIRLKPGMTAEIGETAGTVEAVDLAEGTVTAVIDVPDGSCEMKIIEKSIAPISFITN